MAEQKHPAVSDAPDFDQIAPQRAPKPQICTADTHWWTRTPPVPYEPPGYVAPGQPPPGYTADDAMCQCGSYRYAQQHELLSATPSVKIGTFVVPDSETFTYAEIAEQLRQVWNARGAADLQAIDVEAHRIHAEANRTGREDLVIETVAVIKALDR